MVKLLPEAIKGWIPVRAMRLSPEPDLKEAVTMTAAADGARTLAIPEVAIWNILVIDCEKGAR